ncbi:MAG: translation elongation factor 4 [Alphaproteobacteria bacterium]|nr:translation elongation factor 4 [Alphaproteobacteria bacterium]
MLEHLRNFSIIAHVDHGKSTLADRILEKTGAISEREMRDQVLDSMELERERGITIKMQPVCITHTYQNIQYTLNLIDTPGHIDFSYEVSRSLRAVEGVLLLVDATQGIQAQTLSVLSLAKQVGLTIIPVLTKIDMHHARQEVVTQSLIKLIGCTTEDICITSGKTGEGVHKLLDTIVKKIPPPQSTLSEKRALVFDFGYTTHVGVTAFVRVMDGVCKKGDALVLAGAKRDFVIKDIGVLTPSPVSRNELSAGMIGYIVTGIKEAGIPYVGDTLIAKGSHTEPIDGYAAAIPMVWASLYPQDASQYTTLAQTLNELKLSDSSLVFEQEQSSVLGKGYRCGFLGMLHLEIITERIKREGHVNLIITSPSTEYMVTTKNGTTITVTNPNEFPEYGLIASIQEQWVRLEVIVPHDYISIVSQLVIEFEGLIVSVDEFQDERSILIGEMPLREFMRKFFDRLKSVTSGYGSVSYERIGYRHGDVARMDILLAEEVFPAFSTVVSKRKAQQDARVLVEAIYELLPHALFKIKIQARVDGKIIASREISAMRKDVTGHLYGGDITRKMKLREKQKEGKKRMNQSGKVRVDHDVFLKIMKKRDE